MTMTNLDPNNPVRTFDPNDPYPGITARPLNMPDFANIRPKNPALSGRWVNRSVGPKESTQRLDEMTYAGFRPCKPEEAVMMNGTPITNNLVHNLKIIHGDLIYMVIPREIYEGALKYNWERAVDRLHPARQLATGRQQLSKAVGERGVPRGVMPTLQKKPQAFRPGSTETPADPSFLSEDNKTSSERKED